MYYDILLFKTYFKIAKNYILYSKKEYRIRGYILAFLVFAFFISVNFLFKRVFHNILDIPVFGEIVVFRMLSMLYLTFLIMLVFSNIITSLAAMYMSSDNDYLFSLPIPQKTIFRVKFISSFFHSTWMVIIFGFPVFFAFGREVKAPLIYYFLSFFVLIIISVAPAAIGITITNLVMYFSPTKKIKHILGFFAVIFGILIMFFFRLLNPKILFDKDLLLNIGEYIKNFQAPATEYLPNHFAAKTIFLMATNNYIPSSLNFLILCIYSLSFYFIAYIICKNIYIKSYLQINDYSQGNKEFNDENIELSIRYKKNRFDLLSIYKSLFKKDTLIFLREPTQWSQLLLLFSLVLVHIFNIKDLPIENFYVHNLLSYINIGVVGFMLAAVSVRFVFPSISLEGKNMWFLKSAPVSMISIYFQKFFSAFIPLFILSELLVFISNYIIKVDDFMIYLSFWAVFVFNFTLISMGLGLGALFPVFDYDHISDIATSTGGIIFMLISLIYVCLSLSIFATPAYAFFVKQIDWQYIFKPVFIAFLIQSAISLAFSFLILFIGAYKIKNMEF